MNPTNGDGNEKSRPDVGICCRETPIDLVPSTGSNHKVRVAENQEYPLITDVLNSIPNKGKRMIRKMVGA